MEKKSKENDFPLFAIVSFSVLIGIVLKLFVVDILFVSGKSMNPSISNGERIFVNRLAYGIARPFGNELFVSWKTPKRGDVVIYLWNDKIVVKRCVAVGGDELCAQRLSLDSKGESHYTLKIGEKNIPLSEVQFLSFKEIHSVPEGFILAVGDNYEESVDSRTYGFVSEKNILGRVIGK